MEMFTEYEPVTYLPYISPTPLLLAVAEGDHLVPAELAIAAYERAHQPKELVILPGGHFDAYTVGFDASSGRRATGSCCTWRPDAGQRGIAIACRTGLSIHLTKAWDVRMAFP